MRTLHSILLTLLAIVGPAEEAADLRLPRRAAEGREVPPITFRIEGEDTQAAREAALAALFAERHPAFDVEDPVCAAFLWFAARWSPPAQGQPAGVHGFHGKYYNIGADNFNACQKVCAALAARTELPAAYREAWRARWAREFLVWRLPLDAAVEAARTEVPGGGDLATPADGGELMDALAAAWPGFAELDPGARKLRLDVLAELNAGLDPDGWYAGAQVAAGDAPLVAVPLSDGGTRVYRYALSDGVPVYLPPAAWVTRRAGERPAPAPEASAAVEPAAVYDCVLPGALQGKADLHLHLVLRAGRFVNAWTSAPTVTNAPQRAVVLERPAAEGPQHLKLLAAGNRLLELQFSLAGERLRLVYRVRVPEGDGMTAGPDGNLETAPRAADASAGVPETDWPWMLGPANCNRGVPAGEPLVEDPRRARLVWVGDATIPIGRGPDLRGSPKRIVDQPLGGGWASPVLAEGRLLVWYQVPAGDNYYRGTAELMDEQGGYPDQYALNLLDADEVVHCFDPATGRTLWKRVYPQSALNFAAFNKSGPHLTPCYHRGRLYTLGTGGAVHAVDVDTGATAWVNDIGQRARLMREMRRMLAAQENVYGSRSDFASCLSAAGGVVVCNDHVFTKGGDGQYRYEVSNGLVAFDAETGAVRWHRPGIAAGGNTGTPCELDGETCFLVAGKPGLQLLAGTTGETLWTLPGVSSGKNSVVLAGDVAVCWTDDRVGAWRVARDGASRLWLSQVGRPLGHMPAVADGRIYYSASNDKRQRKSVCQDLATGEILATGPRICNMGFLLAADGRLVSAMDMNHGHHDLRWYAADPADFGPLVERWTVPVTSAYETPCVPVLAAGRMYIRLVDRLACYDLRAARAVGERPHADLAGLLGAPNAQKLPAAARGRAPPGPQAPLGGAPADDTGETGDLLDDLLEE